MANTRISSATDTLPAHTDMIPFARPSDNTARQLQVSDLMPEYNVKWYGAAGDNVTNDAAALVSCMSAINAAGGGTMYFPPGDYYVELGDKVADGNWTHPSPEYSVLFNVTTDDVTFRCDPGAHIRIVATYIPQGTSNPGHYCMLFYFNDVERIQILGGYWTWETGGGASLLGVDGYNNWYFQTDGRVYRYIVRDVIIDGFPHWGVVKGDGADSDSVYALFDNLHVLNYGGGYHDGLFYINEDVEFRNCRFTCTRTYASHVIYFGEKSGNIKVTGCTFDTCPPEWSGSDEHSIVCFTTSGSDGRGDCIISNNHFVDCGDLLIGYLVGGEDYEGMQISDNTFIRCNGLSVSAYNNAVTGNVLVDTLVAVGGDRTVFANNVIEWNTPTAAMITMTSAREEKVIKGNIIKGTNISITGGHNELIIDGNYMELTDDTCSEFIKLGVGSNVKVSNNMFVMSGDANVIGINISSGDVISINSNHFDFSARTGGNIGKVLQATSAGIANLSFVGNYAYATADQVWRCLDVNTTGPFYIANNAFHGTDRAQGGPNITAGDVTLINNYFNRNLAAVTGIVYAEGNRFNNGGDVSDLGNRGTDLTPNAGPYRKYTMTLTASITINAPTNPRDDALLTFQMLQDGSGGHTVTWNAVFKTAFTPNTAAGTTNVATFRYDGTNWVQVGAGAVT